MKTVKITGRALNAIISLPDYIANKARLLNVGDELEVNGMIQRTDDNVDFLELKYGEEKFYLQADLFSFDKEAYKAELEAENKKREIQRLEKMREQDRKEFLEHYNWNGLRCKAAVAAMQGFIINGISDVGSKEDNMKYLASTSVQVADALIKELQETT